MLIKTRNFLLLASFILIILAAGLVALLDRTKSADDASTDVRARASATNALELNATVTSIDEVSGTMVVTDVYFADTSRSGDAKNFGTWTVTVPANFNILSVYPGMNVTIGVDSKTFMTTTRTMTALTIVLQR
jgi:hypothetical protein